MIVATMNNSDLNSICGLLKICTAVSIASRAFFTSSVAKERNRLLRFAIGAEYYILRKAFPYRRRTRHHRGENRKKARASRNTVHVKCLKQNNFGTIEIDTPEPKTVCARTLQ